MAGVALRPALRLAAEATLRPYAQIIFSRDLSSGFLVLLAIATFPRLALATLAALLCAHATTWAFGLGLQTVREGGSACIAVLTTLATAAFSADAGTLPVIGLSAVLSVLCTASFQAVFSRAAVPTHSLPFVVSAWIVILAVRVLPVSSQPAGLLWPWAALPAMSFDTTWLDVPAAMLYLNGSIAGALVLLAIALHSRISLLLAIVGGLVAALVRHEARPGVEWSLIDVTASFNAVLAAMAAGGVWFVPHATSIVLAAVAAALACAFSYALFPVAGLLSLPVLSLPFVLTTIVVVLAARMRQHDRMPATAGFANRPEEALERHLMRVRRFGEVAWLPFRLPFRGAWVVTQSHDGPHTHKGPWRYAYDFEVAGPDGKAFGRNGRDPRDYHCYGLPVLAAGSGTIDQVIDGIADNPIGEINATDNWGNAVVIVHASGLYSVCAHLQPRSIRVKPGDIVKAGTEIARCGNSGRSPIPHLHFHVQRGAQLGGETVAADFGDVVTEKDGRATVAHRLVPAETAIVRPVMRDEALARALAFPAGSNWSLVDSPTGRREIVRVEVDLWGRRLLRSDRASLYIDPYESGLVVLAFDGDRESLLRNLPLALARVPFDQESLLTWRDRIPRRLLGSWPGALVDLLSVVAPTLADVEIAYTAKRSEGRLTIEGTARGVTTRAVISLGSEPHRLEVQSRRQKTVVEISPVAAEQEEAVA